MRKHLWVAGIAAATLIPSFAFAQTKTCEEQQHDRRVAGTVIGGLAGAVLGSQVSGHGARTEGSVIGGVAGAVVGNQIAKNSGEDCSRAYGYYDNDGRWHTNSVRAADASGYYDRDGRWVSGAPAGYVDNSGYYVASSSDGYYDRDGRWVTVSTTTTTTTRADSYGYYDKQGMWHANDRMAGSATGYYDRDGRWMAGQPNGYYDSNGRWVAGTSSIQASGYYDGRGRWVSGPATGRYDNMGRWIPGQAAGHRDARGVWIPDAQPGYYDVNGRWHAGQTMGYYDSTGRWISASAGMDTRGPMWGDSGSDTRSREMWLSDRIRDAASQGRLSQRQAAQAQYNLSMIRREDNSLRRRTGDLSPRNQVYIQGRLDSLATSLRLDERGYDRDRRGQ